MFFVARQQANRAETRAVPVIFIPGIMGTRLELTPVDDAPTRWDPDAFLTMASWLGTNSIAMRRALHHGNRARLLAADTLYSAEETERGWAHISADFYGSMLEHLQRELEELVCPVYAFGYDWRQSNAASADKLRTFTVEVLRREAATEVIVVTHSMGGVVLRIAARHEWMRDRVLAAIHLAQPAGGAPVAFRRCFDGLSYSNDGILMKHLLGASAKNVFDVVSALPGALELLPFDQLHHQHWLEYRTESGKWTPWTEVAKSLGCYKSNDHPPSLAPEFNKAHLRRGTSADEQQLWADSRNEAKLAITAAHDLHQKLKLKCHANTWSLASTDIETDVRSSFLIPASGLSSTGDGVELDYTRSRTDEGDGTVPEWSALALHSSQLIQDLDVAADPMLSFRYRGSGIPHDEFCLDTDVQELVVRIIETVLTVPAAAAGGVDWTGSELFRRMRDAILGDKGARAAEMEVRVAKWLVETRHARVVFRENPGNVKSPDLAVDGKDLDVKFSEGGEVRLREQLGEGFDKLHRGGELILVRGANAVLSVNDYEAIVADEQGKRWPHGNVAVTVTLIEERVLPPFFNSWLE